MGKENFLSNFDYSRNHNQELTERLLMGDNYDAHKAEEAELLSKIGEAKNIAKPCPFCGSADLKFEYSFKRNYGHGGGPDEYFAAGIYCQNCGGNRAKLSGIGTPSPKEELKAWQDWGSTK